MSKDKSPVPRDVYLDAVAVVVDDTRGTLTQRNNVRHWVNDRHTFSQQLTADDAARVVLMHAADHVIADVCRG